MHYILSKEETRVTEKLLDLLFLNCAQLCLTRQVRLLPDISSLLSTNKFRICLTVHYKRLLRKTTAKYVCVWKRLFVTSCSKISFNVGHMFRL